MAYDDETVKAKLSQLNETQDSIMAVSQWIMFHRRHASRTAQIWAKQVHAAFPPKRLSLIYLANDVVQQTKNRGRDEFYKAFSPIIVDSFAEAYSSANGETRGRLKRVADVWRSRNVFDPDVQNALERRIGDVDKGRGAKGKLGGSLFASGGSGDAGVPEELKELANLQVNLSKAAIASSSALQSAVSEHTALTAPDYATPTPPVHAARLNQLLKAISAAHVSLQTTVAARDAIISGLEKLVAENRSARDREQQEMVDLEQKRPDIEDRKSQVEDAIMRGLSAEEAEAAAAQLETNGDGPEIPRPDFEELTPPPTAPMPPDVPLNSETVPPESHTPTDEIPQSLLAAALPQAFPQQPSTQPQLSSRDPRKRTQPVAPTLDPLTLPGMPTTVPTNVNATGTAKRPSNDNGAQDPRRRSFENHTFKRRKTEEEGMGSGDGLELDEDVVGMLG